LIDFKSIFPFLIGLSVWVLGNILLVKKIDPKSTKKNEHKKSIGLTMYENAENKNKSDSKEYLNIIKNKEKFHLNSLITKNISLFTKNPNYKMLAWLIVQLIIFSLFVFGVNIFKTNLMPYFNS